MTKVSGELTQASQSIKALGDALIGIIGVLVALWGVLSHFFHHS